MSRTIRARSVINPHPYKQGNDQDEAQHLIYTPKPLRPGSEHDDEDNNEGDKTFAHTTEDPAY